MTQTRICNYIIFIIIIQHTIAIECNGHGTLEEGSCVCEDGLDQDLEKLLELTDLNKFLEQNFHIAIHILMVIILMHQIQDKNVKMIVKIILIVMLFSGHVLVLAMQMNAICTNM